MNAMQSVEKIVSKTPGLTTKQIAEQSGIPYDRARSAVHNLARAHRIHNQIVNKKAYWYTNKPDKKATTKAEPVVTTAQPSRINKMTGRYLCPELRSTPYRPGAMDAFNLPSRGL